MKKQNPIINLLPVALITTLGLQSMRVLLPLFQQYLRDSVGISSLTLAPIALGLFALAYLPGFLVRRSGLAGALALTMTAIPLLRMAEQISRLSLLDMLFSGAGVILFWWFLACAYSALTQQEEMRAIFPTGLLLGLALDTAIHAAAGTLDLSWRRGPLALGSVFLLAGLVLTFGAPWRALIFSRREESDELAVPGRMFAFGIWLLLQMMVFQNVARLATFTGFSLPLSAVLLTGGNALALLLLPQLTRMGRHAAWGAGLLLAPLLVFNAPMGWSAVVWLLAGQILMAVWLAGMTRARVERKSKPKRLGGSFGNAALLFVLAAFLYYVSYDLPLGFQGAELLPFLGVLLIIAGLPFLRGAAGSAESHPGLQPAQAALGLIILPLAAFWLTWESPSFDKAPSNNRQVRVMSYNLHQGFDREGQLAIEALAQQIEDSGADVVALQEVPRGYLTTGSFDLIAWLSQRLGMPFFFGAPGDPQWGNALLSRFPITGAESASLPSDDILLERAYIRAVVDIGGAEITFYATHFHHRGGDGPIREEQAASLLGAWAGSPGSVLLGDLNAPPDTPEMQLMAGAGLLNASGLDESGVPAYTFPSDGPLREIDYIWYSPDLSGSNFEIYHLTASDHLPLAVDLAVP